MRLFGKASRSCRRRRRRSKRCLAYLMAGIEGGEREAFTADKAIYDFFSSSSFRGGEAGSARKSSL